MQSMYLFHRKHTQSYSFVTVKEGYRFQSHFWIKTLCRSVVMQTVISAFGRLIQKGGECEATICCTASCRTAEATKWDPISRNKTTTAKDHGTGKEKALWWGRKSVEGQGQKKIAGHTCCVSPILKAGKDYWEWRRDLQAGEAAWVRAVEGK